MNLTSILKSLAVCVGAFALTASAAQTWVADSFEAPDGADGTKIKFYKAAPYGQGVETTNYLWAADAIDASVLVPTTDQAAYAARPIADVANNLHLQLDTEGKLLSRYVSVTNSGETLFTNSASFASSPVYVDTMIKFVISEDPPTITDDTVKVAVFVNAESNLVVHHRMFNENFVGTFKTNSVFEDLVIDPAKWYRLTIEMINETDIYGATFCKVYLNGGDALSHANGYNADEAAKNGPLFRLAYDVPAITQVSFQGTAAIDELVVADEHTPFLTPAGTVLTLSFNDTLVKVIDLASTTQVATGGTVDDDAQIAIEAIADWYEINSVTSDVETASYNGPSGVQVTATTGTVSAAANGSTLFINAQPFSGGTVTNNLGSGLPADKVAAWAINNHIAAADLTAAMLNDYLLNVESGTGSTISITSIVVDGTTVTITVAATKGVDLGEINGTLKVVSSDTLPVEGDATYIPFITTDGVAEIKITNSGKFIKAIIE